MGYRKLVIFDEGILWKEGICMKTSDFIFELLISKGNNRCFWVFQRYVNTAYESY